MWAFIKNINKAHFRENVEELIEMVFAVEWNKLTRRDKVLIDGATWTNDVPEWTQIEVVRKEFSSS